MRAVHTPVSKLLGLWSFSPCRGDTLHQWGETDSSTPISLHHGLI